MGLRSLFQKKTKEEEVEKYRNLPIDEALKISGKEQEERSSNQSAAEQAKETGMLLRELNRRFADAKEEYAAVTLYLTDIQKLDRIELDQRAQIEDASRQIMNLNKERGKYQKKEREEDVQMRYLAQYEEILPDEIQKLKEQEQYQNLVKDDLRQLEGERGAIQYERELAERKREFVRKFSVGCCIAIFLIFALLLYLGDKTGVNLNLPFFLASLMALLMIGYIVVELRNTAYTMKYSDLKMNKLIQLVNKVKIKYVNSSSLIEYAYEKYRVNSVAELELLWEEFVRARDEAARYRHNTELLEFYHQELTDQLRTAGLEDPDIWIYQTDAILDEKEMVEVRHRLNVRRQKLRERMDTIKTQMEQCDKQLKLLQSSNPELTGEITAFTENHSLY